MAPCPFCSSCRVGPAADATVCTYRTHLCGGIPDQAAGPWAHASTAGSAPVPTPCSSSPAGGPGFEGPRPLESSGWIKQAVNYFRVVLMVGGWAGAVVQVGACSERNVVCGWCSGGQC